MVPFPSTSAWEPNNYVIVEEKPSLKSREMVNLLSHNIKQLRRYNPTIFPALLYQYDH